MPQILIIERVTERVTLPTVAPLTVNEARSLCVYLYDCAPQSITLHNGTICATYFGSKYPQWELAT